MDETTLIDDFRSVISKLNSRERADLANGLLKALQIEASETHENIEDHEKSDSDEKLEKDEDGFEYNPRLRQYFDGNLEQSKPSDITGEHSVTRDEVLRKRIEELENENKDLGEALEKLDEEHTQSIGK